MKTKKLLRKIIASCLAFTSVASVVSMAACKGERRPDTEQTLEIYALQAGYGTEWLHNLKTLFEQQEWVQEKYPELEIYISENDVKNYAETRFEAGASSNTIDLFFAQLDAEYAGKDATGKEQLLDLTEVVYESQVPGENIKVKEKLHESYLQSMAYIDVTDPNATTQYYYLPWAGGCMSFVYNEDILNDFGIAVPRTTGELIEACRILAENKNQNNGKFNKGYSIIQANDENYWTMIFNGWWAQYEGVENFYNFWNGIDDGTRSRDVFKQKGRLASLEVYEEILDYDKGYYNPSSSTYDFMTAQTMMLQGSAVFNVNGNWFDKEMSGMKADLLEQGGTDYTLKLMKFPVVSSVIEQCTTIADDKELSALIGAIDELDTSLVGEGYDVSQKDYDKIKEARSIVVTIGPGHTSAIPSYAKGKDIAVDFLRFMATDIANESYSITTSGGSLPYNYNIQEKNPEAFEKFLPMAKDVLTYLNSGKYETNVLPSITSFPLNRWGGVREFTEIDYYGTFVKSGNKKTALDYYNDTIAYWTEERWKNALSNAGLQ